MQGAPPARDRNYAWFVTQVEEAQKDIMAMDTPCQPRQALRPAYREALVHFKRRWDLMQGNRMLTLGVARLATALQGPGAVRRSFAQVFLIERNDFVSPGVPTAIGEVWMPLAAVADRVHLWRTNPGGRPGQAPQVFLWLALPPGVRLEAVLRPQQVRRLESDHYHIADIVATDRRAANRRVQEMGFLAGEVLVPPEETSFLEQYMLHVLGVVFVVAGLLVVLFNSGG